MSVFDRYCNRYDAWYDKNRFAYSSELLAIKKVLPKFGKGLEIGVGTGRFAAPLGITFGIDPSEGMLKVAHRRGVNTRCGVGEDLPFLEGDFDYVAIIIALCFVRDPLKVLEESKRILKGNGRIIFGIIDKDSFLGKFYQKKKSLFYKQAIFFSAKELGDMIVDAGFNSVTYYQTLFDLPSKITEIQKPRKGFGKGGFVVVSGIKT